MIEIRVIGLPGPQGSKRFVGHAKSGRGILVESSKKVKPWREAVKYAALEALEEQGAPLSLERHCNGALVGAVTVSMVFTMPRPKSAKSGAFADKRPDLSKLVRSTEDALNEAGVWEDDARVVTLTARKVYVGDICPDDHRFDAQCVPGCVIRVESVTSAARKERAK